MQTKLKHEAEIQQLLDAHDKELQAQKNVHKLTDFKSTAAIILFLIFFFPCSLFSEFMRGEGKLGSSIKSSN